MLPIHLTRNLGSPLLRRFGFDPFNELDRVTGSLFGERTGFGLRVDVREDNDHFFIDADVPGFAREDINVTCEDGVLTIEGERKSEEPREGESYHKTERYTGRFSRSFRLANGIGEGGVEAELKDGVLTVKLSKPEEVKPRKIEVTTS